MKELEIPMINQERGSVDCGAASVAMILSYYNKDADLQKIKEDLNVGPEGAYSPELGVCLIKKGFDVEITTNHPSLFTVKHRELSQEEILKHLKNLQENSKLDKLGLKHFIDFLELGGVLKVTVPNLSHVENAVREGIPIVASLTSVFLTKENPFFNSHYVVIKGFDENFIYANNPSFGSTEVQKYKKEDFLYAMHSNTHAGLDNGSIMIVRKKD